MNLQSKSPTYQRVYSPQSETKLCVIIDSKAPLLLKIPVEPRRLTLAQFKDFVGLNESHYKFYFKSHDSEFGMVKEELIEDDAILPADDGKIVAWVLSNDSVQYSLFNPNDSIEPEPNSPFGKDEIDWYQPSRALSHKSEEYSQIGIFQDQPTGFETTQTGRITRIVANLHLDSQRALGLTILCPSDQLKQSGGIMVDRIQPNSVACRDGRIQPGDRIVEINNFDLKDFEISEAITIFKEFVDRKGAISIVLERASDVTIKPTNQTMTKRESAKLSPLPTRPRGFDPATELPSPVIEPTSTPIPKAKKDLPRINNYRSTYSLPRSITPRSWYASSNIDNLTSSSDFHHPLDSRSVYEPAPNSLRKINVALHCGKDNIYTIYEALKADSTSLDIKDRDWLKVIVKDAFIGATLIKWLSRNVYGFCNRSEIKRFANQLLSLDLIKSPVSNSMFSEKCYYTLT